MTHKNIPYVPMRKKYNGAVIHLPVNEEGASSLTVPFYRNGFRAGPDSIRECRLFGFNEDNQMVEFPITYKAWKHTTKWQLDVSLPDLKKEAILLIRGRKR